MSLKQAGQHLEQRQREMLSAVESTLQESGSSMAGNACLSRYHFQRVFERTVGESPGALRRRLILEPVMHFQGLFGLRMAHLDGFDQQRMPFGFSVANRLIYNGAQTRLMR